MGTLAVLLVATQISFGCPGPVAADVPACQPWHSFPNARFSLQRVGAQPRVAATDATGTLRLRVRPGTYVLTPLRQQQTTGGGAVRVIASAGAVRRVVLRFEGFPKME